MSEVLLRPHPLRMSSPFDVSSIKQCVPKLRSLTYTASAWPRYENAGGWFFLFQAFEAMHYLCDRQGFEPEQVAYCGVFGKGAKKFHMWTAMEWKG